jgi:hypothetical protein
MCDPDKRWCVQVFDGPAIPEANEGPSDAGVPDVVSDVVPMAEAETAPPDAPQPCNGFGCHCSTNAACESQFVCVDKLTVTGDIWNAWMDAGGSSDAGFCAKPCCTSGDCNVGDGGSGASVCFATGAGGNYCVPSLLLGDRSSTIGTLGGGESCTNAPCRSGLCLDSGVCADTCCSTAGGSNAQCATGTICLFGRFPGGAFDVHESANCGPLQFGSLSGNPCNMNSDCRSNLCVDGGGQFAPTGTCEDPCRKASASECAGTFVRATCEYLQPDPSVSADIVAGCVPVLRAGGGDAGPAVCFVDDQNSSTGDCQTGEFCRPELLTIAGMTYSVLACGM